MIRTTHEISEEDIIDACFPRNHLKPIDPWLIMSSQLVKIGDVSHYFTKIEVAVVDLTQKIKVGDEIQIKGATTDFTQKVESMQIEHDKVEEAKAGDSIGLLVKYRVRAGDEVYKL